MATLAQLIRRGKQVAVRRCYIKRRLATGPLNYESDWQRVDFYRGRDRVIDWGNFSLEIDWQPGQIASFNISELQMVFDNQEGHWNVETDGQSIFYPDGIYLNRRLTKLKVECGYLDENGDEVGVATVFEGVIDRVQISEDQSARITVLPYTSILKKYPISDLGLTSTKTTSQIVTAIMNQSKITTYIPYVSPTQTVNITVQDASTLEGTYWDVLKTIASDANAIPLLVGSVWSFQDREAGASSQWDFKGTGHEEPDIFRVTNFDDEGADRVRVYWRAKDSNISVQSSDQKLLDKYLSEPQEVDLDKYNDADKLVAITALLAQWERNKPTIEFTTRFMVNVLKPLDQIGIKIFGQLYPLGQVARWDLGAAWDDGTVWGGVKGAVNVTDSSGWMITRIVKNIGEWSSSITAEKIIGG